MRLPSVVVLCSVALLASACSPDARAPSSLSAGELGESNPPVANSAIPACATVDWISAPAERYRDSPIYVANEQPTEEILAWASGQPGFEELWIDRERLGWITVAFSTGAEERQADLERLFPDVGVVALEVEWSLAELEQLQRRIGDELGPLFGPSSWISAQQGVVGIGVGVLTPERLAAIAEGFADEPICVEGTDPADAPAAGLQPLQGDGWRLLADEQGAGQPYRTGIASDQASYAQLWADIGLSGEPSPVAFESEVAIWFGAVYGSTRRCRSRSSTSPGRWSSRAFRCRIA